VTIDTTRDDKANGTFFFEVENYVNIKNIGLHILVVG
jgi:hypothetical protein